ncbi:phytanoyl-CoA dioxygenase family protein [Sphingomonas agri]|uniref:phytanoyl-CoA dioxygenase family protein n=1 Tax=Sphingomonas agri TaxID=1813878 RepID=UPI00311DE48F
MASRQPLRTEIPAYAGADLAHYWREGYAIVRRFFEPWEIARISDALDQLHEEGVRHGRSFRHGNLFYNVAREANDGEPLVRMVQWPSYHQPLLNSVRLDPRFAELLDALLGEDLKQIINQVHWKVRGLLGDFAWHQDSRSRRPESAYRSLGTAYVQTGLAIDPHTRRSGCMRIIPRSHLRGDLNMDASRKALGTEMTDAALEKIGLSAADAIDLTLEPGDLALWSPYLVHGSGKNSSTHKRRLYINGYVRAADCDRGEWAFRAGRPVPLGARPAFVHFEDLYRRPEPHYPID